MRVERILWQGCHLSIPFGLSVRFVTCCKAVHKGERSQEQGLFRGRCVVGVGVVVVRYHLGREGGSHGTSQGPPFGPHVLPGPYV